MCGPSEPSPHPTASGVNSVKQRQKKAFRDPARWKCPHPGCNRSFAVLWRLKVHYRAPVDARGSGVERGHGKELSNCPKCGVEFQAHRHHTNCTAGRTAGPPAKRKQSLAGSKHSLEDSDSTSQQTAPKQANSGSTWESHEAEVPPPVPHNPLMGLLHLLAQNLAPPQPQSPPPGPSKHTALQVPYMSAAATMQQLLDQGVVLTTPAEECKARPMPRLPSMEAHALDVVDALIALKQDPTEYVAPAAPSLVENEEAVRCGHARDWVVQQQVLQLLALSNAASAAGSH